jgi:hypothetical protein
MRVPGRRETIYMEKRQGYMERWSSLEALETLALEKQFMPTADEPPVNKDEDFNLGRRVLEASFPTSCASMAWLAAQSNDEKIRYRASKAIIDTVIEMHMEEKTANDPLMRFMTEIEKVANSNPPPEIDVYE